MNAYSKFILGAVTIVTMSIVACGKKGGGGGSGGPGYGGSYGCVQVGATCIQTGPGYVGSGTWSTDRRDNSTFTVADVTITLNPNQGYGGGGFGGGFYGGQYGQVPPATQTQASVVIRYANGTLRGQGIAVGGTQGFSVTLLYRNGQPLIVNGQQISIQAQFLDQSQTVMNYQIVGAIPAQGRLIRRGGGAPIGYGAGGYGNGGGFGFGFSETIIDQPTFGWGGAGAAESDLVDGYYTGLNLFR